MRTSTCSNASSTNPNAATWGHVETCLVLVLVLVPVCRMHWSMACSIYGSHKKTGWLPLVAKSKLTFCSLMADSTRILYSRRRVKEHSSQLTSSNDWSCRIKIILIGSLPPRHRTYGTYGSVFCWRGKTLHATFPPDFWRHAALVCSVWSEPVSAIKKNFPSTSYRTTVSAS